MKRNFKTNIGLIILLAVILTGAWVSCKKTAVGYLSQQMRYSNPQIDIPQGQLFISSSLNFDGSTAPYNVKLLSITNMATGQPASKFLENDSLQVWTAAPNQGKDTSLSMILAKRKDTLLPIFSINPYNGQITVLPTSTKVDTGYYSIDISVSNIGGTRIFKNAASIHLTEGLPYAIKGSVWGRSTASSNESNAGYKPMRTEVVKLADSPNRLILKIVDKNGIPFDPKKGEITDRYSGGARLQDYGDLTYSSPLAVTDTAIVYPLPFVEFPLFSLSNGKNAYYRVPHKYIDIDRNIYPRLDLRIYQFGTFEIIMHLDNVVRINPG